MAIQLGETERLVASLLDQVFQHDVYHRVKIETGTQTFQKIQVLTDYLQTKIADAETLRDGSLNVDQVAALQQDTLRLLNDRSTQPLLVPLLSRALMSTNRMRNLFGAVKDYADNEDVDPIYRRDAAYDACDDFEREVRTYGTNDADQILGGLSRRLRAAVEVHFDSLEASQHPSIELSPIAKKYPLARRGTSIIFKLRVTNSGTGPARDLKIDYMISDDCLRVETSETTLGTIQAGDSIVFDVVAEVVTPAAEANFLAVLSWERLRIRKASEYDFWVQAQREDIDWEQVEITEPYSLEAVTSGHDLVGRKTELRQLQRLANLKAVGSGYIYGQKRVGKTSLANAVAESLESSADQNWIVINKGSGAYRGDDAASTLQNLGEVLVRSMKQRIPRLASIPDPDFTHGLAPLTNFADDALSMDDHRILFILDEFDELPLTLLRDTELSSSLFLPLREISNRPGCGFLLIGGEGMQQIINLQGARLNKFRPVEVELFCKI